MIHVCIIVYINEYTSLDAELARHVKLNVEKYCVMGTTYLLRDGWMELEVRWTKCRRGLWNGACCLAVAKVGDWPDPRLGVERHLLPRRGLQPVERG